MQFSSLFAAWGETVAVVVIIVALFAVVFVFPMFSNKKRQKQANALFDSAKVGAIVETVGGVIGKVIEIRETSPVDKEMVLETGVGDNKTTIVFDIRALGRVITPVIEMTMDIPPVQPKSESETVAETQPEIAETEQSAPAEPTEVEKDKSVSQPEPENNSDVQAQSEQAAVVDGVSTQNEPREEKNESTAALTPSANSSKTKSGTRKTSSSSKKSK